MLNPHARSLPQIRDAFAEYLDKMNRDMWSMYNAEVRELARSEDGAAGQDGEPTIFRDDADDEYEMTPEEYDRYLDDWSTNIPADIFQELVTRRSARLKASWDDAAAPHLAALHCYEEAYWLLWETLPKDRKAEVSSDLHLEALWCWVEELGRKTDAAEDAYNNR